MADPHNPLECRECGGRMAPGTALTNKIILGYGTIDFPSDDHPGRGQTFTEIPGEPFLVPVFKCQDCGHSVIPVNPDASSDKIYPVNLPPDEAFAELQQIDLAVDEFTKAMKERLSKKYHQGYRGWDEGYPTSKLLNEILIDSAGLMNMSKPRTMILQLCLDIAARAMMLWFRSRRV